jgi:hypothetical protein
LLGACASGGTEKVASYQGYYPPPQYDVPYKGTMVVRDVDATTVWRYCPDHGVACVVELTDTHCVIVFNIAYAAYRARILRHENGHCQGWPADHRTVMELTG